MDHGVCVNEGKEIKGLPCKECTRKDRCDQYESIQPYIPKVDPFYSLDTEVAEPIAFALSDEGKDNILLVGPPGSGKSSLIMMIAAITDWQLIRFSCSEETRLHAVVGQWLVEGDKMVWSDGYATDALRHGKILLEDEADFMRPELRGALHPLLERDGEITLQQYHPTNKRSFLEVVKRHPDFRWVSTANTIGLGDDDFMYHGVQFMNVAARDRYSVIVEMDYMDPEDESVVLQKKCEVDEDTSMTMAKAAHALRELWKQKEIEFVFGMRRLLAWAKYHHFYEDHGLVHKAIKLSILSFAAPKDKNKIMEILKVHCPHEWVRPLE